MYLSAIRGFYLLYVDEEGTGVFLAIISTSVDRPEVLSSTTYQPKLPLA
jgi:hypothetical protein